MHGERVHAHTIDVRRQFRRSAEWFWIEFVSVSDAAPHFLPRLTHARRDELGPNQACTLFGATAGSDVIEGDAYIRVGYGLDPKDIWRRCLLVLIGYFFVFQITQIIALEFFPVRFFSLFSQNSFPSVHIVHSNTASTFLSTSSHAKTKMPRIGMLDSERGSSSNPSPSKESLTATSLCNQRRKEGVQSSLTRHPPL